MGTQRSVAGQEAEASAGRFLESEGYRVLARNWTCRFGELDLVVERKDVLAFVEVRMRSTAAWGDPAHTVSVAKQRRVVKAALHFLMAHRMPPRVIRFDVISIVGRGEGAELEHIPDAFDAGM